MQRLVQKLLEMIDVQSGAYSGEDGIVRFEDTTVVARSNASTVGKLLNNLSRRSIVSGEFRQGLDQARARPWRVSPLLPKDCPGSRVWIGVAGGNLASASGTGGSSHEP